MSHFNWYRFVTGVAVVACAILASTQALAETRIITDDVDELKIMRQVLEASLDSSGIEDWHAQPFGISAFNSKIRSEYIPTVGAIFTIRVNFPIVEPEKTVESENTSTDSNDLWEHFSSGKDAQSLAAYLTVNEIVGIGVSLQKNEEGATEIIQVMPDSPAEAASLKEGDLIASVDDEGTSALDMNEIAERIQGPEDSTVKLLIHRKATDGATEGTTEVFELVRKPIRFGNSQRILVEALRNPRWTGSGEFRLTEPRRLQERAALLSGGQFGISTRLSGAFLSLSTDRHPYDADKVKTLRNTLLETVARYGHRLTRLNEGERLLLVVSAPRASDRGVALVSGKEVLWQYTNFDFHSDPRERMLLSFDQADLTENATLADIESKVTEQTY